MESHHIFLFFLLLSCAVCFTGGMLLVAGKVDKHPNGGFTKKGNGTDQEFLFRKLGLSLLIIGGFGIIGTGIMFIIEYNKNKVKNMMEAQKQLDNSQQNLKQDQNDLQTAQNSINTGKPLPVNNNDVVPTNN